MVTGKSWIVVVKRDPVPAFRLRQVGRYGIGPDTIKAPTHNFIANEYACGQFRSDGIIHSGLSYRADAVHLTSLFISSDRAATLSLCMDALRIMSFCTKELALCKAYR